MDDRKDRKDNKERKLERGEYQLKNGRYMFKYRDLDNKIRYVYSWRLIKNDPIPKGRKKELPLREKEKEIRKELLLGLSSKDENMQVLDLVDKYLSIKEKTKKTTKSCYKTVRNHLVKLPFGERKIKDVRVSDAKLFLIELSKKGMKFSTIKSIRGVLRPAFRMAYDDQLINRNPFDFELKCILDTKYVRRNAISKRQMRLFLTFLKKDKHFKKYYDGIVILFETGLRISEFVGITLDDIDMTHGNGIIRIDHELMRSSGMDYYVDKPKTDAGTRTIILSRKAGKAMRRILAARPSEYDNVCIMGTPGAPKEKYSRFLYYDKNGMPTVALHWEKYMKHALEKYNQIYKEELPEITPHICRHTYATIKVEDGMTPKTLQHLMGHESIETTMQYYVHWNQELTEAEVARLDELNDSEDDDDDDDLDET